MVADGGHSRVFVIQLSTATLVSTIDTAAAGYDGTGTIAVAPDGSAALAMDLNSLAVTVIHAPFGPGSTITKVSIPGRVEPYQTQAIVFNNAARAFILQTAASRCLTRPTPPLPSVSSP